MATGKMQWFVVGLICLSLFAACDRGRPPEPAVSADVWVGTEGDPHRDVVPGQDIWAEERRPVPQWGDEAAAPDYLSRAERHREFMQAGVPVEYRNRTSPYPATTAVIREGGRLYSVHCAACHGATGLGDGKASRDLTPPPALLAYLIDRPRSVDEYLLWSISEGGAQFGTEMPAFKDKLTERQIWQIVVYMRAGFPLVGESG